MESILVCTGVYNPQNDLQIYLKNLFDQNKSKEKGSSDLDKKELIDALSRQNSLINYFENKFNMPDLTVDNISEAVDHIIRYKYNHKNMVSVE